MVSRALAVGVAGRVAFAGGALLGASALVFAATTILPGDVAQTILGQSATPEALANLRRDLGLDAPPLTRFFEWLGAALSGEFGRSLANGQPVAALIGGRLANTFFLAAVVAVVAVPVALALGLLAARFHDRVADRTLCSAALALISLPEFLIAYGLLLLFAVQLGWLPALAKMTPQMAWDDRLRAVALPAMTLMLIIPAHIMRMTRAAVLNVMNAPYIETARLKGAGPVRVLFCHALPNAAAPIANVVVLNLAYLVVGVVVVEVIFVYPGLGQLMVDSVAKRDLPVVQACGLVFAATYIVLNALADVIAVLCDPKLRHPR